MNRNYDLHQLIVHPALRQQLPHLHREGQSLAAGCPKCNDGTRRFFCGPKFGYNVWSCRQCGHSVTTAALIGQAWTVAPSAAVKAYTAPQPLAKLGDIRAIYGLLDAFAQAQLPASQPAADYLTKAGITLDMAGRAGLGFISWPLYRQWWQSLTPEQKTTAQSAGLPPGDNGRAGGFAAMFAGGYMGKIVFPYPNLTGEIVDIRTRSISPKDTIDGKPIRYTSPRGDNARRGVDIPYGLPFLGEAGRIVLTEGEKKALVPMGQGSRPIIALRGTSDMQPAYLEYFRNRVAILAFDNDDKRAANGLTAGQSATVKHGRYLRAHDVAVMVLDPALLLDAKGIDDFVNMYGIDAFNALLQPVNLITLPEFEAMFTPEQLAKFIDPRADPGLTRQWLPAEKVDTFAHAERATITLDEAETQIDEAVTDHLRNYRPGNAQLLITAPPGVGKTTIAVAQARKQAEASGQTIAVILPNHATIDEKIADGTLAGFKHIYGHNADNCKQAELALVLTRIGYSPGDLLCPRCPVRSWCKRDGYQSQFGDKANRAYVHAHLDSDYPAKEDIVIIDELTHKQRVQSMKVWPGDIANALAKAKLGPAQQGLLKAFLAMFVTPALGDLEGLEFYEVLQRFCPDLRNVDAWGDGSLIQGALVDMAVEFAGAERRNFYEAEELPQAFGEKLITLLSEDVRRLNADKPPTGRVRMVDERGPRHLALTFDRGRLPGWYGKRPTIVLNATADAEIMQDLIGPLKVLAPQVALAAGNEIIHDITRNNAKWAYTGKSRETPERRAAWLERIRQLILAHPGGEADTVIITAKALRLPLSEAFPAAKVAHYGALEGRNDLQVGLTILATAVPVNLDAIRREASALYPGIDTTLIRRAVAFAESNAGDEHLSVEQIDGADPRLQRLIWQHRDAAAIQAVHRARLIRQTGRKVVIMFSRPIPGVTPTTIIRDHADPATRAAQRTQSIIDNLIMAGAELKADVGGFSVESLAMTADCSVNTARKYWPEVTAALDCQWFDLPVRQSLANGANVARDYRVALPVELLEKTRLHADHERYKYDLIRLVIYVQPLLPASFTVDIPAPPPPPKAVKTEPLPGRWGMLRQPDGFKRSLMMAKASADPAQRAAYRATVDYFNGKTDDKRALSSALWAMGESYAVNWQ